VLIGGVGSDRFVVAPKSGLDRVRDFQDGEDRLLLPKGLTFGKLAIEQRGRHTLISAGGEAVMLLRNISADVTIACGSEMPRQEGAIVL
jgi:Ca2+-binding RTX toxin-like protein